MEDERALHYECRHFIDDDGSTYEEEGGIITKRWPKRMVEYEPTVGTGYDICFCDGCYFGTGPCDREEG